MPQMIDFKVFEKLSQTSSSDEEQVHTGESLNSIFYLSRKSRKNGKTIEGFVVLKGSMIETID
ncbi:hypothetical protein STFR1_60269 [Bacillus vallismortis]